MATTQALTDAIVDTSTDVARSTTALLRQATYVRNVSGTVGVVNLAGGEVEVQLNGMVPVPGQELNILQQGYQLLLIGPVETRTEVVVSSTSPTDPDVKLWMKV